MSDLVVRHTQKIIPYFSLLALCSYKYGLLVNPLTNSVSFVYWIKFNHVHANRILQNMVLNFVFELKHSWATDDETKIT